MSSSFHFIFNDSTRAPDSAWLRLPIQFLLPSRLSSSHVFPCPLNSTRWSVRESSLLFPEQLCSVSLSLCLCPHQCLRCCLSVVWLSSLDRYLTVVWPLPATVWPIAAATRPTLLVYCSPVVDHCRVNHHHHSATNTIRPLATVMRLMFHHSAAVRPLSGRHHSAFGVVMHEQSMFMTFAGYGLLEVWYRVSEDQWNILMERLRE